MSDTSDMDLLIASEGEIKIEVPCTMDYMCESSTKLMESSKCDDKLDNDTFSYLLIIFFGKRQVTL
jgi:hypothetical protein